MAVALNALFVFIYPAYYGVAIATVITYYIWYFIGMGQFRFIHIRIYDLLYLSIYTIGFFMITKMNNDILGFIVAFIYVIALSVIFYRRDIDYIMQMVRRKR